MQTSKSIFFIVLFLCLYSISFAQSRFTYGPKIGGHFSYPGIYEFYEPYPYSRFSGKGSESYGQTGNGFGIQAGVFADYALLGNRRLHLIAEVLYIERAYTQTPYNNEGTVKIRKSYLDIPVTFKLMLFKTTQTGLFIESGIVPGIILSPQTDFSIPGIALPDYESRRVRGNEREVNLLGVRVGGGYKFSKFDISGYFQRDKHYSHAAAGLRYFLK